jgi:hypothetical protein
MTIEAGVTSAIHLPHPADADQGEDFVRTEKRAGHNLHRRRSFG